MKWLQPMRVIDEDFYAAKRKQREATIPEDLYCGFAGTSQATHAAGSPPPQPRRRAIGDRVNEPGAWATYQTPHQVVTDAHILHIGSL